MLHQQDVHWLPEIQREKTYVMHSFRRKFVLDKRECKCIERGAARVGGANNMLRFFAALLFSACFLAGHPLVVSTAKVCFRLPICVFCSRIDSFPCSRSCVDQNFAGPFAWRREYPLGQVETKLLSNPRNLAGTNAVMTKIRSIRSQSGNSGITWRWLVDASGHLGF